MTNNHGARWEPLGWGLCIALQLSGCMPEDETQPAPPASTTSAPPSMASVSPTPLPVQPEPAGIEGIPDASLQDPAVPISGGTLLITADSHYAIAADPDRDRVFIVDLTSRTLLHELALTPNSEPGRLIEDSAGTVHVATRRGGTLVSINVAIGQVTSEIAVCSAPRGLAEDVARTRLLVACQNGELVSVKWPGLTLEQVTRVAPDLRDVVPTDSGALVTTFRRAEAIQVDADGQVDKVLRPNTITNERGAAFEPHVARRSHVLNDGRLVVLHQRASQGELVAAYYGPQGTGCNGPLVHNAVSVLAAGSVTFHGMGVLPPGFTTDLAVSSDASIFAAATLGVNQTSITYGALAALPDTHDCDEYATGGTQLPGQAIALAFDAQGQLWAQLRDPAVLYDVEHTQAISLSEERRTNAGHTIFHMTVPTTGVACASCHPEGGDDAVTWNFAFAGGLRRTQSLAGGVMDTLPLHWQGDRADLAELMNDTFVGRMRGPVPTPAQTEALGGFLHSIPLAAPSSILDGAAVLRGQLLFEQLGCGVCHAGVKYSDNQNHDVGSGGSFQTPSLLGVSTRTPLMHHGCARDIRERFGPCGGSLHGDVSQLQTTELDDLVAFLESL